MVWGTDFTIPKSHYKSIEVTYNKTKTVLPAKIIENLFNVSIGQTTAYFDAKTEELYLLSLNSDGAGQALIIACLYLKKEFLNNEK